ncbi:hypothetical protein EJ04DRAFT_536922 [Polyplosphaeria fusca]|uniref:DUF676 domain-containing protein n=1 Tax=Polyplosphaeria fusca TaxID=682080 RepID=A0A9P4QU46_9PLEO|nr:hypothetical protein EJ04DRAFT_536922 [Polyplosphaeria fusca]
MAVHRLGLTRLSGSEESDDQTRLNVIFVHGLRGHPEGTWSTALAASSDNTTPKERKSLNSLFKRKAVITEQAPASSPAQVFWPKQYLAPDIPQASIWTYGYNAGVIGGLFQANNKNSISQHGRDLSIVHSLGGIILKDAIRRSEAIRNRTKLIIFLGTPHRGSAYTGWGQIVSNLARLVLQDSNKKVLEALEVNSEVLDNIHEELKTVIFGGGIKVHSFQEARGISGMKGLDEKASRLSADAGDSGEHRCEPHADG